MSSTKPKKKTKKKTGFGILLVNSQGWKVILVSNWMLL